MQTPFLAQPQLAKRWHLSPRTLERWRWSGRGPAFLKIGGRVLYRIEEIERLEAEGIQTITGGGL